MSNIISSLGAGSGIDVTGLISGLVEAERAPTVQRLDTKETTVSAQISAFGSLKSAMSDLQSLVSIVADSETYNARGVTFPNTDNITPNSVEAGAQLGSFQIEVGAVALSQSLVLETNSDKDATLGLSGELSLQFGAWSYSGVDSDIPTTFTANTDREPFTVEITINDSLSSIANKINEANSGATASVLKIGDNHQLMLTMPSGVNNAVKITSDNTADLGLFEFNELAYSDVEETQQAKNAAITVNGLPIVRDSNNITDVIEGFDFTINKPTETGEFISFSVEQDSSIGEQAIRDFVEGFNLFIESAKQITSYTRSEEDNGFVKGDLANDSIAKTLVNRLRQTMSAQIQGASGKFDSLSALGVRTNLDGTLSIDETTFRNVIDTDFSQLEALFTPTAVSESSRVIVGQGSQIGRTETGNYKVAITQDPTQGVLVGDVLSETFAVPLDTSLGDYSLKLSIGAVTTGAIALTGTYSNASELGDALETLINSDANLAANKLAVEVKYLPDTNQFQITNTAYGSASTVDITLSGAEMNTLGLTTSQTGVAGTDVTGTIDGIAGFGAGQVLLPPIDHPAYGLTFRVLDGASADGVFDLSFSRGVAGELNFLINRFLSSSGPIAAREDTLDVQLEKIDTDRTELDTRLEKYEARLTAQFIAMERIIASLNSTGSSLDGILERLPFTASGK